MGEVHYMISEAAKQLNVEPHVLRYWEEELELPIGRTEMGHRYYTEENIQLVDCIKELKEQGLSLKELKGLIPDIIRTKEQFKEAKAPDNSVPESVATQPSAEIAIHTSKEPAPTDAVDQRLEQVQSLIADVVERVLLQNNKVLEAAVSDRVAKNVDYLLQSKEQQEEERYRKLDFLIRQQQTNRKEAAHMNPAKRLRRILGNA
ncbi:MAG: MerR family transcriptional regulator [Lachnospiraceae bacterium]